MTPSRILRRAVVVLTLALAVLFALAAIGAAQPPTTTTPPSTTPPASSAPAAPTPTGTGDSPAPATPDSSGGDDNCKGHIKIPGINICTPLPSPSTATKDAITSGARSVLSDMVDWVLRGYVWITKYVWALFININVDASGSTSTVQKMNDMTGDLQIVAAGLGLLIALMQILAQRMMLSGDNAAPEAFAGFLRWALAASLAAPALLALSAASDALAHWMFITSAGPEGPTHVLDQLQNALSGRDAKLQTEDVISLVLCVFGLLSLLELAIQLFLQKAWMVYVAVALPIAGAASVTGAGKAVYSAMLRLGVTVLLFKPIAAMLFAVGFWQIRQMTSGELSSGGDVVTAVLVMAAPAFAMPVLVNLIGNTSVGVAGGQMLRGTTRRARRSTAIAGGRIAIGGLLRAPGSFGRGFAEGWRGAGGDGDGSRADARATSSPASPAGNTATRAQQGSKATAAPAPSTGTGTQDNRAAASAATTTTTTSPGTSATGNSASSGPAAGHTTTSADPGQTGGNSPAGTSGTSNTTPTGTRSAAGAANRAGGRSGDTPAPTTAPASAQPSPQTSRPTRGHGEGPRDTTFTRID